MKFSSKAWLLVKVGGYLFTLFVFSPAFLDFVNGHSIRYGFYQSIKEAVGLILIGGFLTAIPGIPMLWVLEKYFSHYRLRYVIGAIFPSYLLWTAFHSLPQTEGVWLGHGSGHAGYFIGLGLAVGIVFTVFVYRQERKE